MIREKAMPRTIKNRLNKIDCNVEGENTEAAVLDLASELGYEVEDENSSRRTEEGGYMHNVKVVNYHDHEIGRGLLGSVHEVNFTKLLGC